MVGSRGQTPRVGSHPSCFDAPPSGTDDHAHTAVLYPTDVTCDDGVLPAVTTPPPRLHPPLNLDISLNLLRPRVYCQHYSTQPAAHSSSLSGYLLALSGLAWTSVLDGRQTYTYTPSLSLSLPVPTILSVNTPHLPLRTRLNKPYLLSLLILH